MEINTKYHGTKEYNEEDILTFKKGIPGFESLTKFILFTIEENKEFSILHSLEDVKIGFIVISPFFVEKDYEINLTEGIISELKIIEPSQVMIINTVTLNSNVKECTTNLQAPIIINTIERLGEQIILDNDKYNIKHPLFKE
jgi:flagellar assembly factor FliW